MRKSIAFAIAVLLMSLSALNVHASEFKNWILVYQHDSSGTPLAGSYAALVDAVRNGADVRVGFVFDSTGKPTSFRNPRLVYVNGTTEVVAITDYPTLDGDGSGNMTLLSGLISRELYSTQGKRELDIYYLNGTAYSQKTTSHWGMSWFVSK